MIRLNPPRRYGKGHKWFIPWDRDFYRQYDIVAIIEDYGKSHPQHAKRAQRAVQLIKQDPLYIQPMRACSKSESGGTGRPLIKQSGINNCEPVDEREVAKAVATIKNDPQYIPKT